MRIGVALIASGRPEYLTRTLDSIAANSMRVPVHAFVDRLSGPTEQKEIVNLISSRLGEQLKTVSVRPVNYGIGRNTIHAREEMFKDNWYDYIFVMEDDTVISPTYFQFCVNMTRWAEERYDNVGAVQGWTFCFSDVDNKRRQRDHVTITFHNLWAYLISRSCWNLIAPTMFEYLEKFLCCDYKERQHDEILAWKSQLVEPTQKEFYRQPYPRPVGLSWDESTQKLLAAKSSGQDAITAIAMQRYQLVRLAPVVNRAVHIGAVGEHMTQDIFDLVGFGWMTLDLIPEDETMHTFVPCR